MQRFYDWFTGICTAMALFGWLDRADPTPISYGPVLAITCMAVILTVAGILPVIFPKR